MLVITRKSGQSVWIGDARVTVHRKDGQVKLVIEAPRHIEVVREELKQREDKR